MPSVYVAAGSNVEPIERLRIALAALRRAYPDLKMSTAYRNRAVGFVGDDFINLVVGFSTDESLDDVLATLHGIEELCGRPRNAPKWAPRSMDLDVLLFGDLVLTQPGITLPRPDLLKRPYMLQPMAEIAPDVVHPTAKKSMRELWESSGLGGHEMTPVNFAGHGT
jgi:2-amino-4-hydroxy-6-hydroxymethyldihydropteridine diphosphokinase